MTSPPVLEYGAPPRKHLLRKTTAIILLILGWFYAFCAALYFVAAIASHDFLDWLSLLLMVPTSILFLANDLATDSAVRRWAVISLITVLINLAVTVSCLGSIFRATPHEAPDGLVRGLALFTLVPFQCLLLALAVMLSLILHHAPRD